MSTSPSPPPSKPTSTSTSIPTPKPPINIQIRLPTPTETHSPTFVLRTTNLINAAYSAPSTTLLKPSKKRTTTKEVQTWLESGEFHLAFASSCHDDVGINNHQDGQQREGDPVGTIHVHVHTPTPPTTATEQVIPISEIGILTVDPSSRSSGLGRALIAYAEDFAVAATAAASSVERQNVKTRIEVPAPRLHCESENGKEKKKKRRRYLKSWYEDLGYEVVGRRALGESVPRLASAFEEDVEILVMEKELGGQ